jgi:phosphatidylserine decarboxylase
MRPVVWIYSLIFSIDNSQYQLIKKKPFSFNQYFTRKFKPGMRAFSGTLSSPVDGLVYASGKVENDLLLQIKGQEVRLKHLLQTDTSDLNHYMSFYLSPADYHRIHAPCDLQVKKIHYLPGAHYTVAPWKARKKKVFLKNERIVLDCEAEFGRLCIVLIAALNVGNIRLISLQGRVLNGKPARTITEIPGTVHFKQGEELGQFLMGSSVILLSPLHLPADDTLRRVSLGQKLA